MITREELELAVARQHAEHADAKPRAEQYLATLRESPYGEPDPSDLPESPSDLPDCWPFRYLEERSARRLLWLCEALPEHAAEVQALWK